jgi:ABC-type sugar transport system ATPase subunit
MIEGSEDLLSVRSVSKNFPGVRALKGVSCSVKAGEVQGLVGQNGAGKSTLVKCITGVYRPDGGEIAFAGERITSFAPKHASDLGIAVVHQRTPLLLDLSVAENVHLGGLPSHFGVIDRRAANRHTRDLLARFGLQVDPDVPVRELQVSERQEVAIARALFRDARLLVLDEPTAALDAAQSERLFAVVENLRRESLAVLYVSHYLEEIFRLSDRITVLRDGNLVGTERAADVDQDTVVAMMTGERTAHTEPTHLGSGPVVTDAPPAVVFDDVSTDVLQGATFSVRPGEVVGFTGVIGAGGHEVARLLFGLARPRSGTITLAGKRFASRGPRDSLDRGVCLVPEDTAREGSLPLMSIAANISLVDLKTFSAAGVLSHRRERQVARRFVEDLGISAPSVDTLVGNLSGGNQQKVMLARALAAHASVLVLEEPTQGVDVHAKREIHRIVRDLAAEGKAALVISTDVRDLLQFVDRVVALRRGRVVRDVPATDITFAEVIDVTSGAITEQAA